MTDLAFQPGWRPDPEDPASLRWWSGAEWSDHRRPAPVGAAPRPAAGAGAGAAQQTARVSYADRERAMRRSNPKAWAGVVLGLIAFILDPFAVPAVLAIVLSAIGLAEAIRLDRQGVRSSGKVAASIGLALGVVAALFFATRFLALLGA